MSGISTIALAGMNVASLRLQVSASNVANALSDGPLPGSAAAGQFPGAYKPLRVDQMTTSNGGTSATVSTVSPSYAAGFEPTAPFANGSGMVARPNVDLTGEIVQQIVARYNFAANAQVLRTDARMSGMLLNIAR